VQPFRRCIHPAELESGAVATPVLSRLGAGPHRRATILATLAIVRRRRRAHSAGLTALMMGRVAPSSETSSSMSFNCVVRSVGYSLGSASGGLILAAGTGPGHLFPDDSAYTTAALVGIGAMAITTLTCLALARRHSSETNP
jgi:hypothetical protein